MGLFHVRAIVGYAVSVMRASCAFKQYNRGIVYVQVVQPVYFCLFHKFSFLYGLQIVTVESENR